MRGIFTIFFWLLTVIAPPAMAAPLAAPKGDVVLTISGAITTTNVGETAQFDMEMLKSLASESFQTTTIWTEGTQDFTGVALAVLLEAVGAQGNVLRAQAINDYTVEIPVDTLLQNAPVVAYEMDFAPMSRRTKGPLWVVYPYASDAQFQTETIYARSIWQLDRIEVVK